jgi:hypothetical protein
MAALIRSRLGRDTGNAMIFLLLPLTEAAKIQL